MSATMQERTADDLTELDAVDPRARLDFWTVYEAHFDEIKVQVQRSFTEDPEFGPLLDAAGPKGSVEQNDESLERLREIIVHGRGAPYVAHLRDLGSTYASMGISFGGWYRVVAGVRPVIRHGLVFEYPSEPERLDAALGAMNVFFDVVMRVIGEEYLAVRQRMIHQQQEAIRELSTPVLELSEGLLLLPIVGVVDSHRARQMTEQLLTAIRTSSAKVVVIDITAVPAIDTMVADHLIQATEAARLLGARSIVTGLSAEVAQTMVKIGIDLRGLHTVGSLRGGIVEATRIS